MLLLCGLLVATLFTGAYDDAAFGFSQGAYMVFLIAFLGGMLVLLLATPRLSVTHLTFCRSRPAAPTSREVPS